MKKMRNAVWQACNGTSVIKDPLGKESISQPTTFGDTSSPERGFCHDRKSISVNIEYESIVVDFKNESVAVDDIDTDSAAAVDKESVAVDIDNESIAVDIDSDSIAVDSESELIVSSDDELNSRAQRFDKFSLSEGRRSLPQRVPVYNTLTHTSSFDGGSSVQPEDGRLRESTRATDELLLEASASYRSSRKRKIEFIDQFPTKRNQTVLDSLTSGETRKTGTPDLTEHLAGNDGIVDLVGTNEELVQSTPLTCCRLPFNGHGEDNEHYRLCRIILAGVILREEHARWLSEIPSHPGVMQVVNLVIGSSCKRIMLIGKCTDEHCTSTINLNLDIPGKSSSRVFSVFTKWFLQNAQHPNLRVILILLSHAPKEHHNVLMTVLSFAKMMVKLSCRLYRQILSMKLKKIMVNTLGYKPWEAVRALLVFTVTPETELSEILDFLNNIVEVKKKSTGSQPLKNRLYESVSCLWHINETFVCPANLLFEVLKECLVKMPADLKLTKDRMVADLLKLPRKSLRGEFLVIGKFLDKYYPQNSRIAHVVKTSVLYGKDVTNSPLDCRMYETCRVKGTGPVNPLWDYWDIREAQMKGFDLAMRSSQKDKPQEEIIFRQGSMDLPKENLEVDVWRHDLFKIITNRNSLCYEEDLSFYDFECLVDLLNSGKYSQAVNIISSCVGSKSLEKCLKTLEREFELCDKALAGLVAFELLKLLPGSLSDKTSVKSSFVRMLNSLVVTFYKYSDYRSAVKLLKVMRLAGVNHMDHVPEKTDLRTFAVICSDINLQCRLYREAIRSLMYEDCLNFLGDPDGRLEQYDLLEKVVKNMLQRFLKERHASHAADIFLLIFKAQESLSYPLDIGKYYEGVLFLSFVRDLKKSACPTAAGANLYITIEKICGNSEPFHSITYRSLLVELHRSKSPEGVIRRVFRICLEKKIYPDFSRGWISPLVLGSHLAKEEMSIYLKYYFTYFIAQNDLNLPKTRPFVVRFLESPRPDRKLFPVSNDIMKTPRSVPDGLERFKSVLEDFSGEMNNTLDVVCSPDCVTMSVKYVETLFRVFQR